MSNEVDIVEFLLLILFVGGHYLSHLLSTGTISSNGAWSSC